MPKTRQVFIELRKQLTIALLVISVTGISIPSNFLLPSQATTMRLKTQENSGNGLQVLKLSTQLDEFNVLNWPVTPPYPYKPNANSDASETPEIFAAAQNLDAIASSRRWSEDALFINLMRGAIFFDNSGRLEKSDELASQALRLLKSNPRLALDIQHSPLQFAYMLESQNKAQEAEFVYQTLLDSEKKTLILNTFTTSTAALAYAVLLIKQDRKADAEALVTRCEHERLLSADYSSILKNLFADGELKNETLTLRAKNELLEQDSFNNTFKTKFRELYALIGRGEKPDAENLEELKESARLFSHKSQRSDYFTWASLINLSRLASDTGLVDLSNSLLEFIAAQKTDNKLPSSLVVETIIERTFNDASSSHQLPNWDKFQRSFKINQYENNPSIPDLPNASKLLIWAKAYIHAGLDSRGKILLESAEKSLSKDEGEQMLGSLLCDKALLQIQSGDEKSTSQTLKNLLNSDFTERLSPQIINIAEQLQKRQLIQQQDDFLEAVNQKFEQDRSKRLVNKWLTALVKLATAQYGFENGHLEKAAESLHAAEVDLKQASQKLPAHAEFLKAKIDKSKNFHTEAAKEFLTASLTLSRESSDPVLRATKIAIQKLAVEEMQKSSMSAEDKAAYYKILAESLMQTELKLAQEMFEKAANVSVSSEEKDRLKLAAARIKLRLTNGIDAQKEIVRLSREKLFPQTYQELLNLSRTEIANNKIEDGITSAQKALQAFKQLQTNERQPFNGLIRAGQNSIPCLLLKHDNKRSAEKLLQESSDLLAEIYGTSSHEFGQSLAEFASFEISAKNYERAQSYTEKALDIYKQNNASLAPSALGFQNPIIIALVISTNELIEQNQLRRAKDLLKEIEKIQRTNRVELQLSFTLTQLAKVCEAEQLHEEALQYKAQVKELQKRNPYPNVPPPFLIAQIENEKRRKDAVIERLSGIKPTQSPAMPRYPQILYGIPRRDYVKHHPPSAAQLAGFRRRSGYIDKTGKWIIKPIFDAPSEFLEDTAIVTVSKTNGSQQFGIDRTGAKIFDVKTPSQVSNFDERHADTCLRKHSFNATQNHIYNLSGNFDGKHYHEIYSADGTLIWRDRKNSDERTLAEWLEKITRSRSKLERESQEAFRKFCQKAPEYGLSNPYAMASQHSVSRHGRPQRKFMLSAGVGITPHPFADFSKGYVHCVIDKDGNLLSKLWRGTYNESQYREGLTLVAVDNEPPTFDGRGILKNLKLSVINSRGETVVKPFDFVRTNAPLEISEGLLCFKNENWFGAIDISGKTVVPFKFSRIFPFSDGLAVAEAISNENGETIDCDDERFGPETKLTYARKCAQIFTEQLKDLKGPHLRFRATLNDDKNFEIACMTQVDTETKERLEKMLKSNAPETGPLLNTSFSMHFLYDNGKVSVGYVKDEPQIALIQERYSLRKVQGKQKTQIEMDKVLDRIKQLNAEIGDENPDFINPFDIY